ncbi:carboxypeptidase regulatory-like domain-containing protein [Myxococcus fulvus]|uniref:carboxypeptidase regulatory-like domain-containing protein n=1 Tax=Myxococcus fulvus TaxID=33 RepID=UPI003B997D34
MRRWFVGGSILVIGVLVLLVWQPWSGEPSAPPRAPTGQARAAHDALPRTSAPLPPSSAGLTLRGTVVDTMGKPVAGARVSASWPEDGETLSATPCPKELLSRHDALSPEPWAPRTLVDCMPASESILVSLLLARQGEAPVHAEALSSEDGSFILEGLPEGPQTLLALSSQGAGTRMGVPAGSSGVSLMLEDPLFMSGRVLDEDSAPVPGVAITLASWRNTRFFDTTTDARGHFKLGPLPFDSYLLLAAKEDWSPTLEWLQLREAPHEIRLGRRHTLTGQVLSNGAPVKDVEVLASREKVMEDKPPLRAKTDAQGRFTFEPGSGHYRLSAEHAGQYARALVELGKTPSSPVTLNLGEALGVEGRVIDDQGAPVAKARVKLKSTDRSRVEELETLTGPDGRYRAGPVAPGGWDFSLEADGYVDMFRGEERVMSSNMRSQDFTLTRAVSITGRVVDGTGRALAGIKLDLHRIVQHAEDFEPQESTFSAEDGSFILDATEPGDYKVFTFSERFVSLIQPTPAPAKDLLLTLSAGGTVEGTVTDSRGQPMPRFHVVLGRMDAGDDAQEPLETMGTDDQGVFRRQGLAPGRYRIFARRASPSVDRKAEAEVEMRDGAVAKVTMRLPEERSVEVLVVDTSGQPVEKALVRARPLDPTSEEQYSEMHRFSSGVSTDEDGRAVLRHLEATGYRLAAMKHGHTLLPERSTPASRPSATGSEDIFIQADTQQAKLVMKRHSHVRGRLLGPDGAPLSRFRVNAQELESEDGTFSLPNHPMVGRTQFIFTAEGLPSVTRAVQGGEASADVDLGDIRLEAGRALTGVVLDATTGEPAENVLVALDSELRDEGSNFPRQLVLKTTDRDGRFDLGKLEARPLTLRLFLHERYREQLVSINATQTEVTVRMDPGARLSVTARDAQGKKTDGFVTYLGAGSEGAIVLENGAGKASALPPGKYTLRLEPRGRQSRPLAYLPQQVDVPASGEVSVQFKPATGGATVRLRVPTDQGVDMALVPGSVPPPTSPAVLRQVMLQGIPGFYEVGDTEVVFAHVPQGRVTVFFLTPDALGRYHTEELDIPASGTMSRTLQLAWRRLDVSQE